MISGKYSATVLDTIEVEWANLPWDLKEAIFISALVD